MSTSRTSCVASSLGPQVWHASTSPLRPVWIPPGTLAITEALAPSVSYGGRLLGPAPSVDPALQGRGFYYSIDVPAIPFGTALAARLPRPGSPSTTVRVPRAAVVYERGLPLVFVALDAGRFEARVVEIRELSPTEWQATRGLANGDRIVVVGAPLLVAPAVLEPRASD